MGVEISRDEFHSLTAKKRDLVIYDNLIQIKKDLGCINDKNGKSNTKFLVGYLWLFVLTVYLGLKKYIPFL